MEVALVFAGLAIGFIAGWLRGHYVGHHEGYWSAAETYSRFK
jgi:hypothetical protein